MAAKKKSAPTKSAAGGKGTAKKPAVKKAPAKKAASKKTTAAKKPAARKTTTSKPAADKSTNDKSSLRLVSSKKKPAGTSKRPASQVGPVPGIAPYKEIKGEDYMGEEQIKHFRNILETWKQELMEEVDRTVHHMQDDAANFPDPNDRATQESEFSMELRTRDRERKLIKKIDEALHNLDNDEYGYCESCGIEIGIRRLEARPTATLCIDCKTLDEIREKQMG